MVEADRARITFATRRLFIVGLRSTGFKRQRGQHPIFLEFPLFIVLGALAQNPDLLTVLNAGKPCEVA